MRPNCALERLPRAEGCAGAWETGFSETNPAEIPVRIDPPLSLAFIGSAEAQEGGEVVDFATEALSIRRLEGSHWRGGRCTYGI